jgi:hypothetical protein
MRLDEFVQLPLDPRASLGRFTSTVWILGDDLFELQQEPPWQHAKAVDEPGDLPAVSSIVKDNDVVVLGSEALTIRINHID